MKLLFIHDVKAVIYENKVYARSYGYSVWKERYLNVFDSIKVLTRNSRVSEDPIGTIDLLSGEDIIYDDRIGMFKGPDAFFNSKIRGVIREDIQGADFVICRLDSFLGLIAIGECKKINKPYLIEVVGCAWDSFWNHGLSGKVLAPFIFLMTKKAIRNADSVIYVTECFLQKRYPTNGRNTNVSNVKLFQNDESILEERITKIKKLSDKKKIIIGTAANVDVRYKGQQFVIRALGELKKGGFVNFEYQLPGAGNSDYLKKEAVKCDVADQVVFLGSLTHEKMMEWYRNIDIYIQPSLQEGLPRAVIEAMSYGVPCYGTMIAGIPELLPTEFLLSKRNLSYEITKKLSELDFDKMLNVAEKNYKRSQNYDFATINARRERFFRSSIGGKDDKKQN